MKNVIKSSVILALLTIGAQAQAASQTYVFDYLAQARTTPTTLSPGASLASLGYSGYAASINYTDLSDLNLGDGKTGVRVSITLGNLSQFSSGTGSIYANSIEFSFPGTGEGSGGVEYITTANSYRNVSGNYTLTTGGDGGIEWDEAGSVGNGTAATGNRWKSFQQQINFAGSATVTPTYTPGETVVFDLLNGDILGGGPNAGSAFDGFTVANLVSVANANTALGLPDAYGWLRVRSVNAGIATTGAFTDYLASATSGGVTTQTLNFLAVTQVPEAETYALFMAGLGLMGAIVRRRKSA
jgi:hypothetical protein